MSKTRTRIAAAAALLAALGLSLAGCAAATEEWNDAKVSHKYDNPAEIYSMPDGFSSVASKCDAHGNRMYVTKNDNGRAVAVLADDPTCDKP